MNENNVSNYVCPVCKKAFSNLHEYANHMKMHSDEEKKREEEEKKKRLEDQKKVDYANLEKLRKMYEDAYSKYLKEKEKYVDKYGENYVGSDLSGVFDFLKNLDGWRQFL